MADHFVELFEDPSTETTGTPISSGNPVAFGLVEKGSISPTITINVWNDRESLYGSDELASPQLHAIPGTDDPAPIFAGTAGNGNVSMLEARSCGARNVAADAQVDWTPISITDFLDMGRIPAGAMRQVELRLNVPYDAPNVTLRQFTLRVQA